MKKYFLLLLAISAVAFMGCNNDDDDNVDGPPEYTIEIISPNTDDKHNGDDLTVKIRVTEKNNKTIHHFSARIYQEGDESVVLMPAESDKHVHEEDGDYTFEKTITLSVTGHHDYILEAKAWGHEAGLAEVVETISFHVHPM